MPKKLSKLKLATFLTVLISGVSLANEITVYSARSNKLIQPIVDIYSQKTGVKVNLIDGKEVELINKIADSKTNNVADVLLLSDAGFLWQAVNAGIAGEINSEVISKNVDAKYLVSKNWVPTSIRFRTIIYNQDLVKAEQLSGYQDLSSTKWQGKLCLRTSNKIYNQSLVAGMIGVYQDQTLDILKGLVKNLATNVFENDLKVVEAVNAGTCELGVVNNYYYLRTKDQNPKVKLFMANQNQGGTLANVAGAVLVKNAPNLAEGQKFIEWLIGIEGQKLIADENFEFSVNLKAEVLEDLADFANAKLDLKMLTNTKDLEPALNLIKQANWQ